MIEQIINWWNSLDLLPFIGLVMLLGLMPFFILIYFGYIIDKRKTTTQKYREGLIKK